jgi:hypothetical protein
LIRVDLIDSVTIRDQRSNDLTDFKRRNEMNAQGRRVIANQVKLLLKVLAFQWGVNRERESDVGGSEWTKSGVLEHTLASILS